MSTPSRHEITAPLIHKTQIHEQGHGSGSGSGPAGENSSIEQVALTVPTTDDPTLPAVTFRVWVLGTAACALLSFLNQFFWYRREPLSLTSVSAQIAVLPLGHLMARALPARTLFADRAWAFTLNPGPFNVKEHALITIFASSGAANAYAIHIVSAVKIFYRREMGFAVALMVVLTTQVLGFGWAGVFRRYLVDPAAMWWPQNLVQVSLYRGMPLGLGKLVVHASTGISRLAGLETADSPAGLKFEEGRGRPLSGEKS